MLTFFCKEGGKNFPVWTPAHLLPPMSFIAPNLQTQTPSLVEIMHDECGEILNHGFSSTPSQAASAAIRFVLHTSQQWLCDVPVEENYHYGNGVLWKDDKFIWGAYGLGWFTVDSRSFGWQLKRFEVCSCRQRLYETTAEPDGIRVLKDRVFRRFTPISRWKPDFEIQKAEQHFILLLQYYTNLYNT